MYCVIDFPITIVVRYWNWTII